MSLCQSIDTLAMAYLDDELADEELRDFELHMIDCAACRGRVDAERESLAELRRRLAPPPTPDVVRARLRMALDAEDAAVSRASLRGRMTHYALPGVASLAAVGALALFVTSRHDDAPSNRVATMVGHSMQSLQLDVPNVQRVAAGQPQGQLDVFRVAQKEEQVQGRTVTEQTYQVTLPSGFAVPVQVDIFDSRGWDFDDGTSVQVNGYELRVVQTQSGYVVEYRASDGVGYLFQAPDLATEDFVDLVGRDLIDRVGVKMHD